MSQFSSYCIYMMLAFLLTNTFIMASQENPASNAIDAVLKFNTEEFRKFVPKQNHYVLFYAPW